MMLPCAPPEQEEKLLTGTELMMIQLWLCYFMSSLCTEGKMLDLAVQMTAASRIVPMEWGWLRREGYTSRKSGQTLMDCLSLQSGVQWGLLEQQHGRSTHRHSEVLNTCNCEYWHRWRWDTDHGPEDWKPIGQVSKKRSNDTSCHVSHMMASSAGNGIVPFAEKKLNSQVPTNMRSYEYTLSSPGGTQSHTSAPPPPTQSQSLSAALVVESHTLSTPSSAHSHNSHGLGEHIN